MGKNVIRLNQIWYTIKDLEEITGLSRHVIKYGYDSGQVNTQKTGPGTSRREIKADHALVSFLRNRGVEVYLTGQAADEDFKEFVVTGEDQDPEPSSGDGQSETVASISSTAAGLIENGEEEEEDLYELLRQEVEYTRVALQEMEYARQRYNRHREWVNEILRQIEATLQP